MSASPPWFHSTLTALLHRRDLRGDEMAAVMEALLSGGCGDAETAALLIALQMKGETSEELASAAAVMRRFGQPLPLGPDVLDTCGTGGDGTGTFNISTATALVVAGCGVPVVKHGNRAISGTTGSADVLAELGVTVSASAAAAGRCLREANIAFCLAPQYHPALRHVGDVRRRLGVRTLFNCLGPLANPAGAAHQLLGVGQAEWLDRMAQALARLRPRQALLVHARDGLDEVSLGAVTQVRQVRGGEVQAREWSPGDFGLGEVGVEQLRVSGPAESAAVIRGVLAGEDGPALRVVVANAAAALLAAEAVAGLREGVERALGAIHSRRAAEALAALAARSRGEA